MYDAREYSVDTIAKTIGVSRPTVYRHLDQPHTKADPDNSTQQKLRDAMDKIARRQDGGART